MLFKKVITVYSDNLTKHIYTIYKKYADVSNMGRGEVGWIWVVLYFAVVWFEASIGFLSRVFFGYLK
jgi:hypothetical protein